MYCKINSDNSFTDLYSLPTTFECEDGRTILNFHLSTIQGLIDIASIYNLEIINGSYDAYAFTQGDPSYEVFSDRIIKTYELIPIPNTQLFETAKVEKLAYIHSSFSEAFLLGYLCPSVTIKMDCQASDLNNMEKLQEKFVRSQNKVDLITDPTIKADAQIQLDIAISELQIRDFNNDFHSITLQELDNIIGDMIDYGLYLYSHKWELELKLNDATTITQVLEIRW